MKSISGIKENIKVGCDVYKRTLAVSYPAKLVSRHWFKSGDLDSPDSIDVPFGATYCVARAVGPGGAIVSPISTSVAAGGGVYARSTFSVQYGQELSVQVGDSGDSSDNQSWVKLDGETKVMAGPGGDSNGGTNGIGGTSGTGDVVRPGNDPSLSSDLDGVIHCGGIAGSDEGDVDALMPPGNGAWVHEEYFKVKEPTYGGGAAMAYNSGAGGALFMSGGDGVVVLEFYTGDPRQSS